MDAATLSSGLDIVAPACGQTLSVSEKAAVETSLPVLKANNGFDTVVFWGRISGISADYLIAQGYSLPYAMIDAATSPAVSFYRCAFYNTAPRKARGLGGGARAHPAARLLSPLAPAHNPQPAGCIARLPLAVARPRVLAPPLLLRARSLADLALWRCTAPTV